MNFVDRTGHIFSIKSYSEYPVGYEYEETPYTFWFETEKGSKLSVDNYYFKPIRIINRVKEGETVKINIQIENSQKFYLIDSETIDNKLLSIENINGSIELYESAITKSQEIKLSEYIDLENGTFSGCIVDESDENNPVYSINESYYVNSVSGLEYTGDIITYEEFTGEYLGNDGQYHTKEGLPEDTLFGIIEIGSANTEVYVIITEQTRRITTNVYSEGAELVKELYLINTFYVVVKSDEAGVWATNVMINVDDEWCPITVSAEIIDEQEELIINGQNIGIKLPKEIVRAIYSGNYNINTADEKIYYQKLKEYLLNFMKIKGESGNYDSAITALKWFEWGDKLTISKLIRNDNRIQRQYVKDFFDLLNDNIYSYKYFKETALLSIEMKLTEDGEQEPFHMNEYFWGENKPTVHNKFYDLKEVKYDEQEYSYKKGYFDFTFNDLGLKLAALKYYYEKYFLPLYIRIHNVCMGQHVYANDIKYIVKTSNGITEKPVFINNFKEITEVIDTLEDGSQITRVMDIKINNNYDIVYFNRQYKKNVEEPYSENNLLYVDADFNEFSHYVKDYVETDSNIYYTINDTCLRIPIEFPHVEGSSEYYNVNLMLSRYINKYDDTVLNEDKSNLYVLLNKKFTFTQTDNRRYQSLIIYPKLINEQNSGMFDIMYWLDNKFRIDLIVNNKLYELIFTAKMPEFNIEMGRLEYKYDFENFRQLKDMDGDIHFNACMYLPNLVNVNNISFDEEITNLSGNIIEYINENYKENIKFLNNKYLNACHLLELTDDEGNFIPFTGSSDTSNVWVKNDDLFELHFNIDENKNTELYSNFFKADGTYNFDESLIKINKHDYDLYIMHDFEKWYGVLISKDCIDYTSDKDKKFKFINKTNKIKIGNYTLTYERSDRKFLLNRYYYIPSEGKNQFKKDDLIVVSLKNNDKLCFKPSHGSKWNIVPLSLGMHNVNAVSSNTELAIISIANNYSEYEKGYYSLHLEYNVDDYANHVYTKKTQFRIDD